jgi:hypothetical protein
VLGEFLLHAVLFCFKAYLQQGPEPTHTMLLLQPWHLEDRVDCCSSGHDYVDMIFRAAAPRTTSVSVVLTEQKETQQQGKGAPD